MRHSLTAIGVVSMTAQTIKLSMHRAIIAMGHVKEMFQSYSLKFMVQIYLNVYYKCKFLTVKGRSSSIFKYKAVP